MKALEGCRFLLVTFSLFCLLFSKSSVALPLGSLANPTQEEIDNVTVEDAVAWMVKYRMVPVGTSSGSTFNIKNEVSKIQRRAGINVTGELDEPTKKLFIIPRCGVPETEDHKQEYGGGRKKRYTLQGTYWQKKDLTYRFLTGTPDLPEDTQRSVLRKSIKRWEEASTLKIREADPSLSDDEVDILISFVRRYHGDPYAFDGPGGTLAHAYYPHSNKGLSGDAHFDDDERFTTGTPDGINLDWVAVHEFGHSMGLEHSNVRESIMYPWYKGYFENIELTSDDIQGIQALYGKPTPTPTETTTKTTTTQPDTTTKVTTKVTSQKSTPSSTKTTTKASTPETPTTPPHITTKVTTKATTQITTETRTTPLPVLDVCRVEKFDAFVMGNDRKTYVFRGEYFWVLRERLLGVESGPTKITSKWKELKTPINSAYTNWDGRTLFFKGNQYWKYFDDRLEEGPRDISKLGLPSELQNPDAVFIWLGNSKTYFFKETSYWRYNEGYQSVDPGYPRPISIWGLPFSINTAISWIGNRKTYFFRDSSYWKLDDGSLTLVSGYPRDTTQIWMKCAT